MHPRSGCKTQRNSTKKQNIKYKSIRIAYWGSVSLIPTQNPPNDTRTKTRQNRLISIVREKKPHSRKKHTHTSESSCSQGENPLCFRANPVRGEKPCLRFCVNRRAQHNGHGQVWEDRGPRARLALFAREFKFTGNTFFFFFKAITEK